MNMKKITAALLAAALALSLSACGSGTAVYVQSVASLTSLGGIAPGDRFPGIVVSENVTEITKDEEKTIKELLVKEGDDVEEGQALFSYDVDELQLTLDKQKLELEQLNATIESYKSQITTLEKEHKWASGSSKLEYTIEIQTAKLDLKEAEIEVKTKETEIKTSESLLEHSTVVSPVKGRVQAISDSGTDNYGKPVPYITIQQAGSYRIKGTLGELQRGGILEGDRMTIVSRTDPDRTWSGTVTLVDYESPTQGSDMDRYYGNSSDEMSSSSKYPFYVELDSYDGLILGQHIYMEVGSGEETASGLSISSAFIAYDEAGNPFVWAENGRKLEKRMVTLGEYNAMQDTYAILEGLTEEDYIAFPDPQLCEEGAPTTRDLVEAEDDGAAEDPEAAPDVAEDMVFEELEAAVPESDAVEEEAPELEQTELEGGMQE